SCCELQLLANRGLDETRALLVPFIALLQPALATVREAEPDPLDSEEEAEPMDLLLEWVLHDKGDPLSDPDSNESEHILGTVLGLLPLLNQDLAELSELREQGGEQAGLDPRLLRCLDQALPPFKRLA